MNETTKTPFWKPALIYGAILGGVGIVLSLVFYFLNLMTSGWISWVSLVVTIAVLAFCLVNYRNEYMGGFATFGKLFVMGLVIGIFASILSTAYAYLLHTVIDPDLMEKIRIATEEKILSNPRMTEAAADQFLERIEDRTLGRTLIWAFAGGIIVNTLFSLVVAAFVKKEETPVNSVV